MGLRIAHIRHGAALAALVCSSVASATPPSALDPNPYSVGRPESVAPFFAAARDRRVDLAIIGDSNVRFGPSAGHENGMGRAFTQRYGCYATRLDPSGANGPWSAECLYSSCSPFDQFTGSAPAWLTEDALPNAGGFPGTHLWLEPGEALGHLYNNGLGIAASHPMDITGPLRWHMTIYRFPAPGAGESAGYFSPTCRERWPGSAWNVYASGTVSTTSTGEPGFMDWSFDVPAGARTSNGVMFCITDLANTGQAVGPLYSQWNRAENTDHTTGIAYSPLLYQGGQNARNAALSLLDIADQQSMTEWFRQVTRLQNGPPMLLVQIMHGGNDAASHLPAIVYERGMRPPAEGQSWPQGAPTNERAGLKQNYMSIINRMRDYWVGAGNDESNLFFVIGSYFPHPPSWYESEPGAADGTQYVFGSEEAIPAWREICLEQPNVAMVNGYQLSTWEEFTSNAWYRIPGQPVPFGDQAHLSPTGYLVWGEAVAEAIKRACDCGPSIDFDFDGRRGVPDLFAFLSLWFAGDQRANFDQDGPSPTVPDIFAFLASWFAGCAGH